MKRRMISGAVLLLVILFTSSCSEQAKNQKPEDTETMNSGKLTVYCDDAIYDMMDTVFTMYSDFYPNVKLTRCKENARNCMSLLLSGNARAIVLSRDYLKDEDSLMKAFKVAPHKRIDFAKDALIFVVNQSSKLDTITSGQLEALLTEKDTKLGKILPGTAGEPEFATMNVQSSVYAHLLNDVCKSKKITKPVKTFASADSVYRFVEANPNAIGVVYLSSLKDKIKYKALKISFSNKKGEYIFPHSVHPANIIRDYYPYVVTHYCYLLEDRMNLPYWFAAYLQKEAKVTRYYTDLGIVAVFAKYKLIEED